MQREGKKTPSSLALALLYLRSRRDWSQKELAVRLGLADYKQISRYETGGKPLSRKKLDAFAAALAYPPEAVDALLFIGGLIEPDAPEEPFSPVALTAGERRSLDRALLTSAWSLLDQLGETMRRTVRTEKTEAARRRAQELWSHLKSATRQQRREVVTVLPEFQNWALAERVCEASIRAAAHKVEEALDLADLAVFIARRVPGPESWRSRVEGFCWAHVGNARRVGNDLAGADKAFAQAWALWRAGAQMDPELLPEWRLLDLEGSLRRDQRRFPDALTLLERAKQGSQGNASAMGRILLKKEFVLEQMGDSEGALAVLKEAAPIIETIGDPRLLFALRFKAANNLWHLQRYKEAADFLPELRELAIQLGNELDLIRVVWLEARIAAGRSRWEDAVLGLEKVRRDFTARHLPYDAALSSLDLALLWLEAGETAKVREIAVAMAWIFQSGGIQREALAALSLFRDAAERETATAELTRRVIAEFKKAAAPRLRLI